MFVPKQMVTSEEIERHLDLRPGWIEQRTGIRERRCTEDGEAVSDLAIPAATAALDAIDLTGADLGLLVLATSTPDHMLPPTAPAIAHALGSTAAAFDLGAACAGFIYGLVVAERMLSADVQTEGAAGGLVIGANVLSPRVNWFRRDSAAVFADGAGALAMRPAADGEPGLAILGSDLASAGGHSRHVWIEAGGSRLPLNEDRLVSRKHLMRMDAGPALFRLAARAMTESAERALDRAGMKASDIDWLIPHQANLRLIHLVADSLGIPHDRTVTNIDRYGNTSAATIPMALHEAVTDGRIKPGHRVLLTAAGAGLLQAAAVLEW